MPDFEATSADYAFCKQIALALSLQAEMLALKCNTFCHRVVARLPYAALYASDMQPWFTLTEREHWHFDQLLKFLPFLYKLPG